MRNEDLKNKLQKLKASLYHDYVFVMDLNEWLVEFEEKLSNCTPEYIDVFIAFKSNLNSVKSVSTLPVTMSYERSIRKMFDSIYVKENMLSGKYVLPIGEEEEKNRPTEDERKKIVYEKSVSNFNSRISSEDGIREVWIDCLSFIDICANNSVGSSNFLDASKELLNQTLLLLWSAFEVLTRDFFVIYMNIHPEKVTVLLEKTDLGNRFNAKAIPIEVLMKYNFDVTNKMGDILIENFDFSNVNIVKAIFKVLLDSERFNKALKDKDIRKLYMMRNLIIHRRGIVDEKYKINTDEKLEIGGKLQVTPKQLQTTLLKVIEFTTSLLGHVQTS